MTSLPRVSVLVPTMDRRAWLPMLLTLVDRQDYPADLVELIVFDDGRDPVGDVFADRPRTTYLRSDVRVPLGAKRNRLAEIATGDILVHFDDDDWQPKERISRSVQALQESQAEVVGKSELTFWDLATGTIHQTARVGPKHVTAGSMAYWRTYWASSPFKPDPHTEERQFLKNFEAKVEQLPGEPWKTVLCIAHGGNTLPKHPSMPRLSLAPADIVPEASDRAFYAALDLEAW